MQLSYQNIISILDRFNIKHESKPNHKNWLAILCPNHNDKHFGSCSINIHSGAINCFSCGYKRNIISFVKDHTGIQDFKELLVYLEANFYINYNSIGYTIQKEKQIDKIEVSKKINTNIHNFRTEKINCSKYKYLVDRGFTNEFCSYFNIERVLSTDYCDRFIVPIINTEKEIETYEFRKLMQYEYYQKYFNESNIIDKHIQEFETFCELNKIRYDKGVLYKNNIEYFNDTIKYLLSPKVKYPVASRINETIFNADNLNYDEDLYVCEGIGSLAKIWLYISKNCTCTFTSNISDSQIDDIFKRFKKRIILIPDNDNAGNKMIMRMFRELKNLYILTTIFEDTDEDYVNDILNTEPISASDYVTNYIVKQNLF